MCRSVSLADEYYIRQNEVNSFKYIQIPIQLITSELFNSVSDGAKILYGLLFNRLSLSVSNKMCDEKGRYYVYYTIENVVKDLNICNTKAKKLFAELVNINNTGIGLIKKVRYPNRASRIYIYRFDRIVKLIEIHKDPKNSGES